MPNDDVNRSKNVPCVSAKECTKDYVSNSIPYNNGSDNAACSDFMRHMLRQELVTFRLTRFNDRVEHYKSWKETANDVVLSLDINANEQIDLIRWLEPESNKHTRSVKSISVSNPEDRLERIWVRLENRYSSPELIERLIAHIIEHFTNITAKDSPKLCELADLLSEIQATKRYPHMRSLYSFDTASGNRPVVEKLPYKRSGSTMHLPTKEAQRDIPAIWGFSMS